MARRPNGDDEHDYILRAVPNAMWERAIARAKRDDRRGIREVLLELVTLYADGKLKLPPAK